MIIRFLTLRIRRQRVMLKSPKLNCFTATHNTINDNRCTPLKLQLSDDQFIENLIYASIFLNVTVIFKLWGILCSFFVCQVDVIALYCALHRTVKIIHIKKYAKQTEGYKRLNFQRVREISKHQLTKEISP